MTPTGIGACAIMCAPAGGLHVEEEACRGGSRSSSHRSRQRQRFVTPGLRRMRSRAMARGQPDRDDRDVADAIARHEAAGRAKRSCGRGPPDARDSSLSARSASASPPPRLTPNRTRRSANCERTSTSPTATCKAPAPRSNRSPRSSPRTRSTLTRNAPRHAPTAAHFKPSAGCWPTTPSSTSPAR
jgi:hypothetical protein